MDVKETVFGELPDGRSAALFTIANADGCEVAITNYGGTVVSLFVPDGSGRRDDVVLGFDRLEDYLESDAFFGCITGRVANRIAEATFTLGGKQYRLARSDGSHHLHGGVKGFNQALWTATPFSRDGSAGVRLTYHSSDGEEGYPGDLETIVDYVLTTDNGLAITYEARTDAETVVNLTNHSYFNLSGAGSGDILDHVLSIKAEHFIPTDGQQVPTGEWREVGGTPLDFRTAKRIGDGIDAEYEQLRLAGGYDHTWVLGRAPRPLTHVADVLDPGTGRMMGVSTTEPGVQFYTANSLPGPVRGKEGRTYRRRHGLCLETQHFPDSPNQPTFPSIVLKPGETYKSQTVYTFSVQ